MLTSSSAYFDPNYGAFVYAGASITVRYIRIDVVDSAGSFIEAGRLVAGVRTLFGNNFVPGSSRGWIDPSRKSRTEGGQTLVQRRPKARSFELSLDFVTATDWAATIETIDRDNGLTDDVLMTLDEDSTNIARDTIWGQIVDLSPVAFTAIPDVYAKQ